MSKPRPNDHAPVPPPRELVREERRLARLRRLRLVANNGHVDHVGPTTDPKQAA